MSAILDFIIYNLVYSYAWIVQAIFFDKIEARGASAIPKTGPCIFAGNHPSGLLDPIVLAIRSGRGHVSCVAKHSLFKHPVCGPMLRALKCIPVGKAYDPDLPPEKQLSAEERAKVNEEMFQECFRLLGEGIAVAIFPEGTTHDGAQLEEIKTGTARIVLELSKRGLKVPIVPTGLTYVEKTKFRSDVLVRFGRPFVTSPECVESYRENERGGAVETVTKDLETRIRDLTVNAPDWVVELEHYCKENKLSLPAYSVVKEDEKYLMQVDVENVGKFRSDAVDKERHAKGLNYKRMAARKAYQAATGEYPGASDIDIIQLISLARDIYAPEDRSLRLDEYSELTRRFVEGYYRRAGRSAQGKALFQELTAYQEELDVLKIKDKDVVNSFKKRNRINPYRKFSELFTELLIMWPLSLCGTLIFVPIGWWARNKATANAIQSNDHSVEATMKVFYSSLVALPSLLGVSALGPLVLGLTTTVYVILLLIMTGLAAVKVRPVSRILANISMTFKLMLVDISVLRKRRSKLKSEIQALVEKYEDPKLGPVLTDRPPPTPRSSIVDMTPFLD